MQTADLIERLSAEGGKRPRNSPVARLTVAIAAGSGVSFLVMWWWLGFRPDLAAAIGTSAFWMKFAYPLALAATGFWLVERLGQPGVKTAEQRRLLLVPPIIVAVLALIQLAQAPAPLREHLLMGASSRVCPWRIVLLSLPIFAAASAGLRYLAPTRLAASGAAAGLLAGAMGACIYAFHCDESTAPFIAAWYSLGIVTVSLIGAASGKWLLRW